MRTRTKAPVLVILSIAMACASDVVAQESNAEELVREAETLQQSTPVQDSTDGRDKGVRAIGQVFDRRNPKEKTLLAVQKMTCSSRDGWRGLVCGQAVYRLQQLWKRAAGASAVTIYAEKYLPLVLDSTLPKDMRMSYAVDINMDLPGMRTKGMPYAIPDEVRETIARGMASMIGDPALRHEALQACLTFGADVPEAEKAVLTALRSEDAGFRERAFFLLTSGANGRPRVAKGLKGVLDGRGRAKIIGELRQVLTQGSAKHPARVVAMAALSAGHLANPIKGIDEVEAKRHVELLSRLIKSDGAPEVRYRAFEGLLHISKFGPESLRALARQGRSGYDPRADERKTLGGEGPYADWKGDD